MLRGSFRVLRAVKKGKSALSHTYTTAQAVILCMYHVHCLPGRGLGGTHLTATVHTTALSGRTHPVITTHPSVVSRDTDPRWEGRFRVCEICNVTVCEV